MMRYDLLALAAIFGTACASPKQSQPTMTSGWMPGEQAAGGSTHESSDGDSTDDGDGGGHPCISAEVIAAGLSSISGGEALAVSGDDVLVKSLQDPLGAPLQLTRVVGGSVTSLGLLPASIQNSDLSGIDVDAAGNVIVLDEEFAGPGSRILSVDPTTLQQTVVRSIPWVTNPHSNGTGQEQFTVDPDRPELLYIWDSTIASVLRLDRTTGALEVVAALEPAVGNGLHLGSYANDIVFDPYHGTLLLTDGPGKAVLEIDPSTSPGTVTTLFAGLPESPHAIAIGRNTVYVEAGFDSVYAGRRHGHHPAMHQIAGGFPFLADIVFQTGPAGGELLAVDKSQDLLYRIRACDSDDSDPDD